MLLPLLSRKIVDLKLRKVVLQQIKVISFCIFKFGMVDFCNLETWLYYHAFNKSLFLETFILSKG